MGSKIPSSPLRTCTSTFIQAKSKILGHLETQLNSFMLIRIVLYAHELDTDDSHGYNFLL
ncbi:hypothetical protein OnM2_077075 [Erysiphe neolycopersici]|uniref:Uncharacterized protein n=1 Tax=Erysiphe neolycopersici TaxID=212602 RepID=A0A420HHP7_9PEZI|nr:hypothetical protein OnM2_077075 [Erysiphe neolycopersici]